MSLCLRRWLGCFEEAAELVDGSQPAHQHARPDGGVHAAAPGPVAQPRDEGGGAGPLCPAPHTASGRKQSDRGRTSECSSIVGITSRR